MKIKRLFPCVLSASVALGMLSPSYVVALGLGDIEAHSSLNQPLNAEIKLFSLEKGDFESLSVGLASPEIFAREGLDRLAVLNELDFELAHIDGEYYVMVSSHDPITEPFLDFFVEVNWNRGRLIREYTLLLDPPDLISEKPAPVSAPATTNSLPLRSEVTAEPVKNSPQTQAAWSGDDSIFYGETKRHDTLWEIALEVRPDSSVSVFQVMMALLKANPESFYNNNINSLKAGHILRLDDVALFTAISKKQASKEYTIQNQQWQAMKQGKAQIAGENLHASEAVTNQPRQPNKTRQQARLELAAPDEGVLNQVGGPTAELVSDVNRLQDDLELALQSNETTERENALLQTRLVELETKIKELNRLLSVESEAFSNLQNKELDTTVVTLPEEPASQTSVAEESQQQVATPPVASVEQPVQKKEAPKSESFIGGLFKDPTALGLVVAVGLGLLALGAVVMRRRSRDNESFEDESYAEFIETPPLNDNVESGSHSDLSDMSVSDEEVATHAATTEEAVVAEDMQLDYEIDPLDEADVYIAYRRYPQAEDLLKEAIQIDPERNELHVKLLEIYVATEDQDAFIAQAELLKESIKDDEGHLWNEVSSMASQISPGHALFQNEEQVVLLQDDIANQLSEFDANALKMEESSLLLSEEIDLSGDNKLFEEELVSEHQTEEKKPSLDDDLEPELKSDNSIAFEGGLDAGLAPLLKGSEESVDLQKELGDLPYSEDEFSIPEVSLTDNNDTVNNDTVDSDDDWLSKMDEVGTRLDLARAYVDMGDDLGAREILDDVLDKGDEQQKKDALNLMEQIS